MLAHRTVEAGGVSLHALEAGGGAGGSIVLLHGWPQDASSFARVVEDLGRDGHVLAFDLPDIAGSRGAPADWDKRTLAKIVRDAVRSLGLEAVTLVGHDAGGMVVYAYLRAFPGELARAAILNVAIPGVEPWDEVRRNPQIWHWGFHAVPELPELLVSGHEARYFDFFFDAIAGPQGVPAAARAQHVEAYLRPEALHAGFELYRSFPRDEAFNRRFDGQPLETPVLYVRGDHEYGQIETYLAGLRRAGVRNLTGETLDDCGHFSPQEQPAALAAALRRFAGLPARRETVSASSG